MSDIFVEFLRFADERGLEGFTYQEAVGRFGSDVEVVWLSAIKSGAIIYRSGEENRGTHQGKKVISFDGKFKLLDHHEVVAAQKAAKFATLFSVIAIFASVAIGSFQIYLAMGR